MVSSVSSPEGSPLVAVDVRAFIDGARFSPYQKWLVALCFATVFFDGFNVQALAVAAPMIRKAFYLTSFQLGTLFAAGSLGGIIAGFAIAPIADRIGRRPLIVCSVLISSLLTLLYAATLSLTGLMILRVTGGFFLAVAVTIVYAYAAEIAPKRRSATSVMVTSAGFGLGVAATGFVSGWLLPLMGWRSIFYFGGGGCLILGILLIFALPESVRLMAQTGQNNAKVRQYLRRIAPEANFSAEVTFHLDEEHRSGMRLGNLLKEGRALPSIAVWVGCFFVNFVIYVFMQWLPSFVSSSGGTASQSGDCIGWFKIGGILGSFACAYYIDRRRNPYPILSIFLVVGALTCIGLSGLTPGMLLFVILAAFAGFFLSGPQYANNGLMARLFPTYVRGAGLAITAGVGRVGAMAGPFTVGVLLQKGWSNQDVFVASIFPTLISAIIFVVLGLRDRQLAHHPAIA